MDDNQDSLRYALIGSLGKGKKAIFDNMIDLYLQSYGISNLEDLTLKDLQKIKKELMGTKEEKEKRGRGRPRKTQEFSGVKEENFNQEQIESEHKLGVNEEQRPEEIEQPQRIVVLNETQKDFEENKDTITAKPKRPMAINIDEDVDAVEDTDLDPALLGELGAFF